MLAAIAHAATWSTGDTIGIVGLVITVLGFGVTLWQLIRTSNASIAASGATKDAVIATSRNQLLILLPQFRVIETELDWAISLTSNGRDFASRVLTSYVHLANEVAGLITIHKLAGDGVCDRLRQSAAVAAATKNKLYASRGNLASITAEFRTSLAKVGALISEISASQQSAAVTA